MKRRAIGVIVFGILLLMPSFLYWANKLKEWQSARIDMDADKFWLYAFFPWGIILTVIFVPLGIGILRQYNWARIFLLWFVWIIILPVGLMYSALESNTLLRGSTVACTISLLITFLIVGSITFYFTRRKIKELFN